MSAIRLSGAICTMIALLVLAGCGDDEAVVTPPGKAPQLTQVTNDAGNDQNPDWSPDGSKIAFYSDRTGNEEIWTITVE